MLKQLSCDALGGGINFVDIGASGRLDRKWKLLESRINLIGFEPNRDECRRLCGQPNGFHTAAFYPYAVAGQAGVQTLYKTISPYCYSLLQPNQAWLDRFEFGEKFRVTGTDQIEARRLDDIGEISAREIDVIKTDSQGLELPILRGGSRCLERAFFVETETGMVENYRGETTYAQIDAFMRDHGFLLFDLNVHHRQPRKSPFSGFPSGGEQILWCEAVWLKDYVGMSSAGRLPELGREKALRVLLLCAFQRCFDFGFELARLFGDRGWLSNDEVSRLANRSSWCLETRGIAAATGAFIGSCCRLLSKRGRHRLLRKIERTLDQPDLLRLPRHKRRAA